MCFLIYIIVFQITVKKKLSPFKVIIMRPIAEEIFHLDFLYPPTGFLIHRIGIGERIAFTIQGRLLVLRHESHVLLVIMDGIDIIL